jgi:hypothetical protein
MDIGRENSMAENEEVEIERAREGICTHEHKRLRQVPLTRMPRRNTTFPPLLVSIMSVHQLI